MQFEVMYETPPMRGFFHTVVNADSANDAEQTITSNPETANYRIKRINKIIKFEVIKDIYWEDWGHLRKVFRKGDICNGVLYQNGEVSAESRYYPDVYDSVDLDSINIL